MRSFESYNNYLLKQRHGRSFKPLITSFNEQHMLIYPRQGQVNIKIFEKCHASRTIFTVLAHVAISMLPVVMSLGSCHDNHAATLVVDSDRHL